MASRCPSSPSPLRHGIQRLARTPRGWHSKLGFASFGPQRWSATLARWPSNQQWQKAEFRGQSSLWLALWPTPHAKVPQHAMSKHHAGQRRSLRSCKRMSWTCSCWTTPPKPIATAFAGSGGPSKSSMPRSACAVSRSAISAPISCFAFCRIADPQSQWQIRCLTLLDTAKTPSLQMPGSTGSSCRPTRRLEAPLAPWHVTRSARALANTTENPVRRWP
mmetsp:Transcript_32633/g.75854  ORF Transcript_32633/g.75854 Transcript_32633/m.75854 type:complete len:219 (+) Transcript_32633:142-798(+)